MTWCFRGHSLCLWSGALFLGTCCISGHLMYQLLHLYLHVGFFGGFFICYRLLYLFVSSCFYGQLFYLWQLALSHSLSLVGRCISSQLPYEWPIAVSLEICFLSGHLHYLWSFVVFLVNCCISASSVSSSSPVSVT